MIHSLRKDQKRLITKKAVTAILKATELSHAELATLIGASRHTVTSWMRSTPAAMAPEFEWRILYATGALIRRDGSVALGIAYKEGKNGERLYYERYSNASFKFWKQYSVSRPEMINKSMIDSAKQSLESILKAAATKGHTPGMKFQFGAVVASYELWVKRTVKEFRLKNRLQTENVPPKK